MTAAPDSRWQTAARHPELAAALAEDDAGTLHMGSRLRAIGDDASVDEDVRYLSDLLATVAWFMPNGNDWTNPYGPFATFGDRRSPITADFAEADIAALAEIAELVPSLILRSRILDVVAIAGDRALRPTRHAAQLQALADHGVTSEAMAHAAEQWDRGLSVGVRYRGVAAEQLDEIERQLVEVATRSADGWLAVRAARMLGDHRLGREHAAAIAAHVAGHAEGIESIAAQQTLEVAAEWYRRAGDPEGSEDAMYTIVQRLSPRPKLLRRSARPSTLRWCSIFSVGCRAWHASALEWPTCQPSSPAESGRAAPRRSVRCRRSPHRASTSATRPLSCSPQSVATSQSSRSGSSPASSPMRACRRRGRKRRSASDSSPSHH